MRVRTSPINKTRLIELAIFMLALLAFFTTIPFAHAAKNIKVWFYKDLIEVGRINIIYIQNIGDEPFTIIEVWVRVPSSSSYWYRDSHFELAKGEKKLCCFPNDFGSGANTGKTGYYEVNVWWDSGTVETGFAVDQLYFHCPPYPIGAVQPEYSGVKGGYDVWWGSEEYIAEGHKIQVWGLDPNPTRNWQGQIVAGGEERLVLFVDDKPVGQCASDHGISTLGWVREEDTDEPIGTIWWHGEDIDRSDKSEWTQNIYDEFLYLYTWKNNSLAVWHYLDGLENHKEYEGAPPTDPLQLLPSANSNRTYQSAWHLESSPDKGVGGVIVSVDKFGLLAPYIGSASVLVTLVAVAVYVKRFKGQKEKQ